MLDPVKFGRAMMAHSLSVKDDTECNAFSRVGYMLMNIGEPGYPKSIYEFRDDDLTVITRALEILGRARVES